MGWRSATLIFCSGQRRRRSNWCKTRPHGNRHQGDLAARVSGLAVRGGPAVAVNKISVAEEHYCTAATQMIMSRLYSHVFSGRGIGRVRRRRVRPAILTSSGCGWSPTFRDGRKGHSPSGRQYAGGGARRFVAQRRPDLLGLSATMTFHLAGVTAMVRELRASQETRGVRIMVGGHAFNREPDFWRDIGADGGARRRRRAAAAACRPARTAERGWSRGIAPG